MNEIKIFSNNLEYSGFKYINVSQRLDALSDSFSASYSSTQKTPVNFSKDKPVQIFINEKLVLTGYIDITEISYDPFNHDLFFQGRDSTSDIVDSHIDVIDEIKPPITLKEIIEKIIININSSLKVVDELNPKRFENQEDLISPGIGENCFQFIQRYARKANALISSNADGNILITGEKHRVLKSKLRFELGSDKNNILGATFSEDNTQRFNIYKFFSGLNPIASNEASSVTSEQIADQDGVETDSLVRRGRQFVSMAEENSSNANLESRAKWTANVRKSRSRVYSVTVKGFEDENGEIWQPNTLVSVIDDFAGINARMLINTVDFSFSSDGSLTNLGLIQENAYSLEIESDKNGILGNE